jgi:hypothetical protein
VPACSEHRPFSDKSGNSKHPERAHHEPHISKLGSNNRSNAIERLASPAFFLRLKGDMIPGNHRAVSIYWSRCSRLIYKPERTKSTQAASEWDGTNIFVDRRPSDTCASVDTFMRAGISPGIKTAAWNKGEAVSAGAHE